MKNLSIIKKVFILLSMLSVLFVLAGCDVPNDNIPGGDDVPNDNIPVGDDVTDSHVHSYTYKTTYAPGATIQEPSCIQKGLYYYACACGEIGTETYDIGFGYHTYEKCVVDKDHLVSEATCQNPAEYYYTCQVCENISDSETFFIGDKASHKYENNLCVYDCGEELNKYTLSDNGDYYTLTLFREEVEIATIPSEYNGIPVKAIGAYSFASVPVKEIVLPQSVTEICANAFYTNSNLERINLENIITIGDQAFSFCSALTEIDISSAVVLGADCFYGSGLTSVTIPRGVTSIGSSAFSYCNALAKVEYLAVNCADLEYPDSAFYNTDEDSQDMTVFIGEQVTKIPDSMFAFSKISKLEFAENSACTEIGERAFSSVKGLKKLVLDTVESIGDMAFCESSITELTLDGAINTVGLKAFGDCEELTTVTIGVNRGGFSDYLFSNSNNLHTVYYLHEGTEVLGGALNTPGKINLIFGKNVKTIPANFEKGGVTTIAFEEGSENVTIGSYAFVSAIGGELDLSSVVSIGDHAFYRTGKDLTKLTLGENLVSIGSLAFNYVGELNFLASECADVAVLASDSKIGAFWEIDTVTFGKNVKRVPGNMFLASKVGSVRFEADSICSEIGENAFSYATVTNLSIPSSLKIIKDSAFEDTKGVTTTLNLNSVSEINSKAFFSYDGAISLSKPTATVIGAQAFSDTLIEGTLDLSNVTTIGESAFWKCDGISKLIFGAGFVSAGENAFYSCKGITEVEFYATNASDLDGEIFSSLLGEERFSLLIGAEVTRIPKYMFSHSSVSNIVFEGNSNCKVIAEYAFSYTYQLESQKIVLPDSVERVESNAFSLTKAESITFGSEIKYIGAGALHSMGIVDITDYGLLQEVYFTTEKTFAIEGTDETVTFIANSEDNAFEYAKLFFNSSYAYVIE